MIALNVVLFSSELRSWFSKYLQILLVWQTDFSDATGKTTWTSCMGFESPRRQQTLYSSTWHSIDGMHDPASILSWTCVLQSSVACSVLASASTCFIRFSLFFFYLRLFKPHDVTRWLVYGGMLASGIFYTAAIITPCVLYIPPPGWPNTLDGWLLRSAIMNNAALGLALAQSVFGTISDIYLLIIPIQSVFQLQLPMRRKLGVGSIFMIGIMWAMSLFSSRSYWLR